MQICFATNNKNKVNEIRHLVGQSITILSLNDIGCNQELPENQKTLEGNSLEKVEFVYENYGVDCFADDTGLEVFVLDGEPGVLSARYAGDHKSSSDNMQLLLQKLNGISERNCQFRTVITLIHQGKTSQFEGVVMGSIATNQIGVEGFGYDPIFVPNGFERTFAEMSLSEKSLISHRAIAMQKLVEHLKKIKSRS